MGFIPNICSEEPYVIIDKVEDRKIFVDLVHDGLGRLCEMYYDPKTKRHELEPLLNQY